MSPATLDRRSFLQAAAGAATLAVVPGSGSAEDHAKTAGRPTPQQALAQLMEGHERYLQGRPGADSVSTYYLKRGSTYPQRHEVDMLDPARSAMTLNKDLSPGPHSPVALVNA